MTKQEHALITGGAGFIGSHLCDALIEKNIQIQFKMQAAFFGSLGQQF